MPGEGRRGGQRRLEREEGMGQGEKKFVHLVFVLFIFFEVKEGGCRRLGTGRDGKGT